MPHSKSSVSTGAPVGSATAKAPRKAASLAASRIPTLPGTPLICAAVEAIVCSASKARRTTVARSAPRSKDLRRSSKSPPPPLQLYFLFPSSSTDTAASPTLSTGASTSMEPTQHSAPPRPTISDNDLRTYLNQRRPVLTGAAPALDTAPPCRAKDPPPATPALPGAPRLSVLRRLALTTPSAVAAVVPALTPVPRTPKPPTVRPPPSTAAPGDPSTRASTRAKKRKQRRILKYAQLLFDVLPAHSTTRPHEAPSGAASAARPPSPPTLHGTPASPLHAPPVEPPPEASPTDHSAPAAAAPLLDARDIRPVTSLTPPAASSASCAHLAAALGLADDDDPPPPPDHTSPPPGYGDPPSDMDISPPTGIPPPRLRPDPPLAATHSPVARGPLAPYLVREPPSWRAHGFPPGYPLTHAVELAAGDKSIPPELLPRLRTVLQETRLASGLYLRGVVQLALGSRGDTPPPPRPSGSTVAPPGSRRKLRAVRLQGAAPRPVDPAPPAAAPRALTQLSLPPTPPPRGSPRSSSPSDIDSDQISVELHTGSDLDLSSSDAPDSRCPSPPAAAHQRSSPSPPPARPPPRRPPGAGGRPGPSCPPFPTMATDGTRPQLSRRRP
jgi:hypothetical protein